MSQLGVYNAKEISTSRSERFAESVRQGIEQLKAQGPDAVLRMFREIGALSRDGQTTTLYGGGAEPDQEAMEAHRLRQEEAFRKLRGI